MRRPKYDPHTLTVAAAVVCLAIALVLFVIAMRAVK
jgi:hypothetical protein